MTNPHRHLRPLRVARAIVSAGVAGLAAAGPGFPSSLVPPPGAIRDAAGPQPNGLPGHRTERIINRMARLTAEQLRISQIAAARTASPQVRTFAALVEDASQDLQQEINRMARSKSILLPADRSSAEMAAEEREWHGKDARDLDGDYVHRVVELHRNAIDALEDYADDRDVDPEVGTFASRHLPALREHLRQAENLRRLTG